MNQDLISKAESFNRKLNRLMPFLTPAAVIIGLISGEHISWMKPAVTYLFALMTFLGTMKIGLSEIKDTLKHPMFIVAFAIGSYVLMPVLAELAGSVFFHGNDDLISGYNLLRAIPTGVVCTVWTSILSGNLAAAISILLLDTFLAPFMTPLLLRLFTGESVAVDSIGMMRSLIIMVLIPSVLGLVFNRFFRERIKEEWAPLSNPLSKLLLVCVIAINTSKAAGMIMDNISASYILIAFVSLLVAALGFPAGYLISRLFRLDRSVTISVTLTVAMRNVSAALVLATAFLPDAAALPVIFCIVFQQSLCAVMGNLLFGR